MVGCKYKKKKKLPTWIEAYKLNEKIKNEEKRRGVL